MTTYCSIRQTAPMPNSYDIDTGLYDNRHRKIGYRVFSFGVEIGPASPSHNWPGYAVPKGLAIGDTGFGVRVQPIRAGYTFGAYQGTVYFRTQAEVDAYIERRVREGKARYAKQFAAFNTIDA